MFHQGNPRNEGSGLRQMISLMGSWQDLLIPWMSCPLMALVTVWVVVGRAQVCHLSKKTPGKSKESQPSQVSGEVRMLEINTNVSLWGKEIENMIRNRMNGHRDEYDILGKSQHSSEDKSSPTNPWQFLGGVAKQVDKIKTDNVKSI